MAITQNLDFHMVNWRQVALDKHVIIAKGRKCLSTCQGEGIGKFGRRINNSHPLSSSAGAGFNEQGEA